MTWSELGVRNAGFRTTLRALQFAMSWGVATASLGHEPGSVEEYAEFWGESRATAFREQQAFREAFPNETTPARMNALSGLREWSEEIVRIGDDLKELRVRAKSGVFTLGAAPADVGS
jgi:hypothetical protein